MLRLKITSKQMNLVLPHKKIHFGVVENYFALELKEVGVRIESV